MHNLKLYTLFGKILTVSHRQKQCNSSQNPLSWWLLGSQVKSPHICGPSLLSAVHWTLVRVFQLLLLCRYSSNIQHWHGRGQISQDCFGDDARLSVPTCS